MEKSISCGEFFHGTLEVMDAETPVLYLIHICEQVVLIENEFGQIGIDGGFLKNSGIEIREMNSGCICCSLVVDFVKSLEEVLTKYQPDRVIIEPSGVGKLSDVMKAVRDVASTLDVVLNSAVTIVDLSLIHIYFRNHSWYFCNRLDQ